MDDKSNDGDESSVSGNNTFDFADGQQSGGMPSARLFVRNDIFAFKSKRDF